MGNSSSMRKVTIANEEALNNIIVSDTLMQRAKKEDAPEKVEETNYFPPKIPAQVQKLPMPISPESVLASLPLTTSLQVRSELETQLRKSDEFWLKRLEKVKEQYKMTNQKMEEEFEAAVRETTKNIEEAKDPAEKYPCRDLKDKVKQCYQDNPRQSILCSKDVKLFQTCLINTARKTVETNA